MVNEPERSINRTGHFFTGLLVGGIVGIGVTLLTLFASDGLTRNIIYSSPQLRAIDYRCERTGKMKDSYKLELRVRRQDNMEIEYWTGKFYDDTVESVYRTLLACETDGKYFVRTGEVPQQ